MKTDLDAFEKLISEVNQIQPIVQDNGWVAVTVPWDKFEQLMQDAEQLLVAARSSKLIQDEMKAHGIKKKCSCGNEAVFVEFGFGSYWYCRRCKIEVKGA